MQSFSEFPVQFIFLALITQDLVKISFCQEGFFSAPSILDARPLFWKVTNLSLSPSHFQDLLRFTRCLQEGPCSLK